MSRVGFVSFTLVCLALEVVSNIVAMGAKNTPEFLGNGSLTPTVVPVP
jgi:hypothetical protein